MECKSKWQIWWRCRKFSDKTCIDNSLLANRLAVDIPYRVFYFAQKITLIQNAEVNDLWWYLFSFVHYIIYFSVPKSSNVNNQFTFFIFIKDSIFKCWWSVSFEEHSTPTRNVITLLSLCSNTLKRTR